MPDARVITVPALKDNYSYILAREGSDRALAIDPSEEAPVAKALAANSLKLDVIVNTHHHPDHVGGNLALARTFSAHVYCSTTDLTRVPGATRGLADGEIVGFDGLKFRVLAIPGHTQGQIALFFADGVTTDGGRAGPAVFVGDTLFAMGCGRLFEGTPEQMWMSLGRLARLPRETRLFFGHEYTERNAAFAKALEPQNTLIDKRLEAARAALSGGPVVPPPTLAEELEVNPFLRAGSLAEFTRRRAARDTF